MPSLYKILQVWHVDLQDQQARKERNTHKEMQRTFQNGLFMYLLKKCFGLF